MQEKQETDEVLAGLDRARKKLERDMGPVLLAALRDPLTHEIMCNPDGSVWLDKRGERMKRIATLRPAQAESIIKTVAGYHRKEVTRYNPILDGELPIDGSRFAGQLPPVVSGPTFAIRRKALAIFTLDQYVEQGILSETHCAVIKEAVKAHRNILVVGGTGSGKTTLVNAIIAAMVENDPFERLLIIEDTGEIQCGAANYVQYHTSQNTSMTDLTKVILRMRPDRILVGEVRGAEALDLLDGWNTGHPGGAATLHADDALAGLVRLKSLVTRNTQAPSEIEPLIGEAVHLVVFIAKVPEGRKVQEVFQISGYQNGQYITKSF